MGSRWIPNIGVESGSQPGHIQRSPHIRGFEQVPDSYASDTREFAGKNTMRFASNPILSLVQGGALEFWVAPDWQADL